jgi:predicted ATP-dependent serine protease
VSAQEPTIDDDTPVYACMACLDSPGLLFAMRCKNQDCGATGTLALVSSAWLLEAKARRKMEASAKQEVEGDNDFSIEGIDGNDDEEGELVARAASEIHARPVDRIPTGIRGFDHVTSGGFGRSNAIVLAGRKGGGKTSIGIMTLHGPTLHGYRCMFVSSEQEASDVKRMAVRLEVTQDILIVSSTDLDAVLDLALRESVDVLVLDSAQRFALRKVGGSAGSDAQQKAIGLRLKRFAHRESSAAVMLLCQAMKNAQRAAGPESVGHDLDGSFILKKNKGPYRTLVVDGKNRLGATDGVKWKCGQNAIGQIVDRSLMDGRIAGPATAAKPEGRSLASLMGVDGGRRRR